MSAKTSKAMVHVYDATNLFLINRQLADEYILDGDVATVCKVTTVVAMSTDHVNCHLA